MTGRSSAEDADLPSRRGLFWSRLRDARIRSKLGLILVVPLIAVVVLAAVRLIDIGQRAAAAEQVSSLAAVSTAAADMSHQLHRERVEAVRLLSDSDEDAGTFHAHSSATDRAVERYQDVRSELGNAPAVVEDWLTEVDRHISELGTLRRQVVEEPVATVSVVLLRYGVVTSSILSYQEAVSGVADDPALAEELRAAAALAKAKAQAAEAEAHALVALSDGRLTEEQLTTFLATQTGQQEAFLAFGQAATPEQQALADAVITGGNVVFADRAAAAMLRSTGDDLSITADAAASSFSGLVAAIRWVEAEIYDNLLNSATDLRDAVLTRVLVESVAVSLALLIAIALAVLLARMLARSLGQLREGALGVANKDLPETVERFSDPSNLGEQTPAEVAAQVRDPIQLRSRDEVGQVAQAFNVVHQSAVRVAAEQAALRTSVSAMFLSLARRSQTLVDRMINHLDDIERNEEDPKRLSRLFSLDHLATRMRRNDENLLVLAGADSGPPRTDDAAVADALRAAQSEVEHYDRIEFGTVDADVSIAAQAVNDVVRLVAELFDNATRFSPPEAAVVAEARRLGDQLIIQVEDRGVGMSSEQSSQLNAWLAAPPAMELTTFRRMGLAVVGRLAARHSIRVELHSNPQAGTVAYAALPPTALVLPAYRARAIDVPGPRAPSEAEQISPAAPPPVPARHLGQLPQRTPDTVPSGLRQEPAWSAQPESRPPQSAPPTGQPHASAERSAPQAPAPHQPPQGLDPQSPGAGSRPAAPAEAGQPVAGRPPDGMVRRSVNLPPPDQTVEIPIFQEVEAVWFRSHGQLDLGATQAEAAPRTAGTAAGAAAPTATPHIRTADRTTDRAGAEAAPHGAGGGSAGQDWRTAADDGWNAAQAAAQPQSGGATQSGLPKRVPQAQLVPGGVETSSGSGGNQRRSPDEVRGLLSAYHRGVQRGREHWGR